MQALARLVQPPAEQLRPPAPEPGGPKTRDLAVPEGTARKDGGAERNLLAADNANLNRLAPRGTYLNIVV